MLFHVQVTLIEHFTLSHTITWTPAGLHMDFIWTPSGVTAMESHNSWSPHGVNVEYVESILRVIWNSRCTYVDSI